MAIRARGGLLAAACLLTAAAAGVLAAWLLRPAPEIRLLHRPEATASGATTSPDPERPAAPRPARAEGMASRGDRRPQPSTAVEPPPPRTGPAAWIEVSVRGLEDGAGLEAYALAAGSRGVDEIHEVPHASFDVPATGRIPIPGPGRYDVGVVGRQTSLLAMDVVVEAGESVPVVLERPRLEAATFVVEGPIPALVEPAVSISLAPAMSASTRAYPGRDDPPRLAVARGWSIAQPAVLMLPTDRDFEFVVAVEELQTVAGPKGPVSKHAESSATLQPSRGVVRAGDTVTLRFESAASLRLVVRTEPPIPRGTVLEMVATVVQGRSETHIEISASGHPGRDGSVAVNDSTGVPGPATVRWKARPTPSGRPTVEFPPGGPVEVRLEPGRVIEVPIDLRIDASAALARLATARPVRIVPRMPDGVPPPVEGLRMILFRRGAPPETGEGWSSHDADGTGSFSIEADDRVKWTDFLLLGGPDAVSELQPLPETGTLEVPMRPGGQILVVTDALPLAGSGNLSLRRTDGNPFAVFELVTESGMDTLHIAPGVVVEPGTVLGPFAEGTHSFDVHLGGVRVGQASARVLAGRLSVLRLPIR